MTDTSLHRWLLHRWYGLQPIGLQIPFSWLFVLLSTLRRACYARGIFRTVRLPVPVIVVGNITVGGTGKTPLVIWLIQVLRAQGFRPGIVTRGYGGQSPRWPLRVTPTTGVNVAGDEALLLARATSVPVMAGPDRVAAARKLLGECAVDVIVSDDGLQHYRLGRDLQMVTLDGERGLGNGWRLPAGPLRESAERFRQALANFRGRHVHALAGIGNPEQFFALLTAAGIQVEAHAMPDHVKLSERDVTSDDHQPVQMTEQDAVKCEIWHLPDHWYVPALAEFSLEHAAAISQALRACLHPAGTPPNDESSISAARK